MNPKIKKDNPTKLNIQRKQGKSVKEFVPPSKNSVREMIYFKQPSEMNRKFKADFEPIDLFPEWPSEEEVKNFEFGVMDSANDNSYLVTQDNLFYDPKNDEINLPASLEYYCQSQIKWLRPEQYIREYLVEREVKILNPNKNSIKLRKRIKETFLEMNQDKLSYHYSGDLDENKSTQSNNRKKHHIISSELTLDEKRFRQLNKEIFKYYDMHIDIKVVPILDNNEPEKEKSFSDISLNNNNIVNDLSINLNNLNNKSTINANRNDRNKPEQKTTTNLISLQPHQPQPNKVLLPSDLSLDDKLPNFSKWMSSIMQLIKDLEMFQISSLIYPQKDGVPVFNPVGRYWVKLFHMGKYRKVEIDDRMPCTKFDEFLFPRCESIEELWPALLTKAICKLYSYKVNKIKFLRDKTVPYENSDVSVLYSLTGFVPEHLNLNFINEEKLLGKLNFYALIINLEKFDFLVNLLSDSRYLNQQKFFICYNNYALESSTKKLNYKLNQKESDNNTYNININSPYAVKNNIDQPFIGINIFKNYLKNKDNKNKNFMYSEISVEGNTNYLNTDISITEGNDSFNHILTDSNKKIYDKSTKKTKNSEHSKVRKSVKPKIRTSSKLLTVKEIHSPSHTSPVEKANPNDANKKFSVQKLNPKDEMIFNKLFPINFKDSTENLIKEKDETERSIRLSIIGKEKVFQFSQNSLINVIAFDSLQIPQKEKTKLVQIKKIHELFKKQEYYYKEETELLFEQRIKNIFSNTAYSIIDLFFSGDEFNMRRLLPVDFTDLKKKILAAQTNFKLLSALEKKNYISNLKELKLKHKEEKKLRLLELNEPGEKIYMIKIKNNIKNALNNFVEKFTNEEISMAKKCLINNWRFPPPSYFESTYSKIDQVGTTTKKVDGDASGDELRYSNSVKLMNTSWTKDFYINMIRNINDEPSNLNISHMNNNKTHEDLEIYKNCLDTIERQKGGVWINWNHFLEIFKGFVIVHNPKHYKSVINVDNNWYNYKNDIYCNEKLAFFLTTKSNFTNNNNYNQNNVVSESPNNINNMDKNIKDIKNQNPKDDKNAKDAKSVKEVIREKDSSSFLKDVAGQKSQNTAVNPITAKYNTEITFNQGLLPNTKFYNSLNNSCFLIVFEPNTTYNHLFADMKYYIIFDLISSSGKKIFSNIRLSGYCATYQFDEIYFDHDYYLIITGGIHPFGYNLRILSDHYVETLTYFNYIKKFHELHQHTLAVGYPAFEKNKIYVIARVKIINKEKSNFMISIKQNEANIDNYLRQYYEVYLVVKKKERKIYLEKLEELEASDEPIYLIYTITAPFNILEGGFDLEFLYSDPKIKIELIDLVEPYQVSDKYSYNKHGILMKEQIYIPENTSASFEIELRKRSRNFNPNINSNDNNASLDSDGILDNVNYAKSITEFQTLPQSVRLILELKKEDKLIVEKQFYSRIFISHLDLDHSLTTPSNINLYQVGNDKEKKDPKSYSVNTPYNLVLKFDLSECPQELKGEYEDPNNEYFWFVRIFPTENIAFMKDTSKEETEGQLKESWEARQPGRAEKAKMSRKKYLLYVKKHRGETLSPEEESLLNEFTNRVYITNLHSDSGIPKKGADGKNPTNIVAANNTSANSNIRKESFIKKDNKEDPLSDEKAYNQAQYLKQSFYARMNKTRTFPKPENHCSLYLKNFLSYVYRERTVEYNNKMKKYYLDQGKIHELYKILDEKVSEYNNKRNKDEIDFIEKKKKIVEEKNQVNKKHLIQRRQYSSKISEIFSVREKISNDHKVQGEKENSLQEVLNGDYDLEKCVQIYKEICLNTTDYQNFKKLCVQVFSYISEKKDEYYKNEIRKFNPKDKSSILKCLEDYKSYNWIIPEDTIKKLNEFAK